MTVLHASEVTKHYVGGDGSRVSVLEGVDLELARGEMVAIVGASGAGKSTLLHICGALDRPSSGRVSIDGQDTQSLNDDELGRLRNSKVGFVFQFHHLLREFTAVENVMMPMLIAGNAEAVAMRRAEELLGRVGLAHRLTHRPSELSGGEQQRTAVARALAADPVILLADEPSGNLDHSHSEQLHDLLAELANEFGVGMVVVTHNSSLASRAHRVLLMKDGQLRPATVGEMTGA